MTVIPPSYDIPEETVEKVRSLVKEDVGDIAFIFKVLSDPLRIGILKALNTDHLCVCVFVEVTNQRYSLLSYHLKQLKEAKLVDYKKQGKFLMYHLTELGKRILDIIAEIKESL
ncbi:MAG: metalloregulator ArsR/SmtB family transcription factor [Methanophagales archaeon]|nr:metalloregulator ArsR/SmtB family transcription factor [Methanophagales archaeon]MCW3140715.1 metalloregulator ArsR/SmtB family transcription factor [Methanophagales archaeon]